MTETQAGLKGKAILLDLIQKMIETDKTTRYTINSSSNTTENKVSVSASASYMEEVSVQTAKELSQCFYLLSDLLLLHDWHTE